MSAKELHVYIFCQVGGRERERERTLPLSRSGPRTLSPLFSIRAASSRNPWVGQPACQPWETRGERVLSCEVLTLPPLPFRHPRNPRIRFDRIEIWSIWKCSSRIFHAERYGSESCVFYCYCYYYFLILSYPAIRYDTIRYDTSFVSFHYPVLKGSWRRPDWVFPIKSRIW